MQIKTLRLGNPLFGGSNTIRAVDAEMIFDDDRGVVYIKRRVAPKTEYVVSLATVEHMEPLYPMTVFSGEPVQLPLPLSPIQAINEMAAEAQKNGTYFAKENQETLDLRTDDEVRLVKINGKIVERKGEKKPDEIEALEYAALEAEERKKTEAAAAKPIRFAGKKPTTVAEMLASTKVSEAEEE